MLVSSHDIALPIREQVPDVEFLQIRICCILVNCSHSSGACCCCLGIFRASGGHVASGILMRFRHLCTCSEFYLAQRFWRLWFIAFCLDFLSLPPHPVVSVFVIFWVGVRVRGRGGGRG